MRGKEKKREMEEMEREREGEKEGERGKMGSWERHVCDDNIQALSSQSFHSG